MKPSIIAKSPPDRPNICIRGGSWGGREGGGLRFPPQGKIFCWRTKILLMSGICEGSTQMDPHVSVGEDRMRRLLTILIKLGKPGGIMVPRQLVLTFASRLKVDVNDLIKVMDMSMQRYRGGIKSVILTAERKTSFVQHH